MSDIDNASDTLQLVDYRKKRRRSKRGREFENGQWRKGASDSEMGRNGFDDFDALSDDSLPSLRAKLAASLRYREKTRGEEKESTPLLGDHEFTADADEKKTGKHLRKDAEDPQLSDEDLDLMDGDPVKKKKRAKLIRWYRRITVAVLTVFFVGCIVLFALNKEHEDKVSFISVQSQDPTLRQYAGEANDWSFVTLKLWGPFKDQSYHTTPNYTTAPCPEFVFVCEYSSSPNISHCPDSENPRDHENCQSVQLLENFTDTHHSFETVSRTIKPNDRSNFSLFFSTLNEQRLDFQVTLQGEKLSQTGQVIVAAVILVGVYVLIGFDIVHRTLAAMIGSTCVLGVLSMLDKRPTLARVVEWIDIDTISLLFGMMTLVAIFSQTGFFDYSAVKAYKIAKGRVWSLITLLCFFSAVVSAFLDNVTTILLLTPVSIRWWSCVYTILLAVIAQFNHHRLCQVLNLDPRPILIAEVVFSNIGGTATAIGDPPNVIIVSNRLIRQEGIDFPEFTLHLSLGIILCMVTAYILLLVFIYCFQYVKLKNKDPPHIAELKREIAIWERTARRLPVVSLEERAVRDALRAKAAEVQKQLKQEINVSMQSAMDLWQKNLSELEQKYRITNKILLAKSSIVLLVVILLFFLSNTIPNVELDLGWIALFGAVALLILADVQEMEGVLHKIEWATLLFFAALFILMEGLAELGLISFIGQIIVDLVKGVPPQHQLLVAIVLIVWVSAIASSFIDNIPFTTATIPVIVDLANSNDVCLSLRPLVWALAFGACLGGNGTLIGASANVVCAGIAEQNGYRISFKAFLKIGFPMMLITSFTAMCYLLICHVAAHWNAESALQCVASRG